MPEHFGRTEQNVHQKVSHYNMRKDTNQKETILPYRTIVLKNKFFFVFNESTCAAGPLSYMHIILASNMNKT